MNQTQRQTLQAAMRLPYPTFPCLPDKKPATPHGFKDASAPEAGLATLWIRYPGELIGVPTGAASGIAVLDIDRGKGGGDWYAANKTRLPATRVHRTRSGGLHLLFKHAEGLRNSAGKVALDSGAKRNEVKRSGFGRPFQARQARLGMAS